MQEIGCAGLDSSDLQILVECLLKVLIQITANGADIRVSIREDYINNNLELMLNNYK